MQLAVEALPQNQQRDPVHMEIVAATGASAERDHEGENNQKYNPDNKYGSHGAIGRG